MFRTFFPYIIKRNIEHGLRNLLFAPIFTRTISIFSTSKISTLINQNPTIQNPLLAVMIYLPSHPRKSDTLYLSYIHFMTDDMYIETFTRGRAFSTFLSGAIFK